MRPLISVIVPVYNVEKYLRPCVDSILAQTYQNLEIILINDGSTDKSGQICDEYATKDKRVRVIHQANQGVSVARNAGLEGAQGQYIGFVDGDDYIDPDMYQYLYNLVILHKVDIAVCNIWQTVKGENKLRLPSDWPTVMSGEQAIWSFMNSFYLVNKLFAAHLFKEHPFDPSITYCEDKLLLLPMFLQTSHIAYGPAGKYHYRLNPSGCTEQFNIKNLSFFTVQDRLATLARKNNKEKLATYLEHENGAFAVRFLRQIAASDYTDASVIRDLQNKVRAGIGWYVCSSRKIINKLFALTCCINFGVAKQIYILLQGKQ